MCGPASTWRWTRWRSTCRWRPAGRRTARRCGRVCATRATASCGAERLAQTRNGLASWMTTLICAPVGVLYDVDSPAECPMMAAPRGDRMTFLVGSREVAEGTGLDVYSERSPLGLSL